MVKIEYKKQEKRQQPASLKTLAKQTGLWYDAFITIFYKK